MTAYLNSFLCNTLVGNIANDLLNSLCLRPPPTFITKTRRTGAKENAQAVARAPAQAAEAVSGAVKGASKAATSVKEGAYGVVDAVSRLADMPAEMAENRRRQQEVRTSFTVPSLIPLFCACLSEDYFAKKKRT